MTITKALLFATEAHDGQFRKDGKTEYITHPVGVAHMTKKFGGDENQYIAALLHDVVEDCDITIEQIDDLFGPDVAMLVKGLTNTSKLERPDLNRAARKALDNARLRIEDPRVKLVKLCDILYNVADVGSLERGFARKFLGEKREQAEAVRDGSEEVFQKILKMIERQETRLGL